MLFNNKKAVAKVILRQVAKASVAVIIAMLVIGVFSNKIAAIQQSLTTKRQLSYLLESQVRTTEDLKSAAKLLGNNDKRIETSLPPSENILDFVAILETLANQNSLQQTLKFETPTTYVEPASGLELQKINYNATINGNVFTLINYLRGFEKLPYMTRVRAVGVTSTIDKGWEKEATVNISAEVYTK